LHPPNPTNQHPKIKAPIYRLTKATKPKQTYPKFQTPNHLTPTFCSKISKKSAKSGIQTASRQGRYRFPEAVLLAIGAGLEEGE
jgi:hypothetical protein